MKINWTMLFHGLAIMIIGTFILQMIANRKVNGQTVKESFFGFSGHSGVLNFGGDND